MTNLDTLPRRELGVDFGDLAGKIEGHSYPVTTEEFVADFGEAVLELPNGTESVREILESAANETYESPREAQHALFTMVGSRAIGRKYYSDRTPPALGEDRNDRPLSF